MPPLPTQQLHPLLHLLPHPPFGPESRPGVGACGGRALLVPRQGDAATDKLRSGTAHIESAHQRTWLPKAGLGDAAQRERRITVLGHSKQPRPGTGLGLKLPPLAGLVEDAKTTRPETGPDRHRMAIAQRARRSERFLRQSADYFLDALRGAAC